MLPQITLREYGAAKQHLRFIDNWKPSHVRGRFKYPHFLRDMDAYLGALDDMARANGIIDVEAVHAPPNSSAASCADDGSEGTESGIITRHAKWNPGIEAAVEARETGGCRCDTDERDSAQRSAPSAGAEKADVHATADGLKLPTIARSGSEHTTGAVRAPSIELSPDACSGSQRRHSVGAIPTTLFPASPSRQGQGREGGLRQSCGKYAQELASDCSSTTMPRTSASQSPERHVPSHFRGAAAASPARPALCMHAAKPPHNAAAPDACTPAKDARAPQSSAPQTYKPAAHARLRNPVLVDIVLLGHEKTMQASPKGQAAARRAPGGEVQVGSPGAAHACLDVPGEDARRQAKRLVDASRRNRSLRRSSCCVFVRVVSTHFKVPAL
jgi:hypothetical protein